MQVTFTRWCMEAKGRTPVSVNPARVDCVEHFSDAYPPRWEGEDPFPACTKIIMQGKQEYMVQGTVPEVTDKLNGKR